MNNGNKENSTPLCPIPQDYTMLRVTLKHRNGTSQNIDTLRSASSPQLKMTTTATTKPSRSKVYRKASLKKSLLKHEIDSDISEKNNIGRYANIKAEKKQKRRNSISEKDVEIKSDKWNPEDIHITCNPLSTPYPYSTPAPILPPMLTTTGTTTTTTTATMAMTTMTTESDDEPKSRSCGSFLPIFALIPQSVISFQYLSPKMKFSWWRNKIS